MWSSNFIFGSWSNSARKQPKMTYHAGLTIARHVLDVMPQRGSAWQPCESSPHPCRCASSRPYCSFMDTKLPQALPIHSSILSLPRSRAPARPCRSRGRVCHGRPAKLAAARVLTALGPHDHSHVHHRLHLIVLHLARTRAEAVAAELTVLVCRRPCSPPAHVARRPRATSRWSSATHGCALASSCFPTTSPTMAWPPFAEIRKLQRPSSI
jgi:hypothetical protein